MFDLKGVILNAIYNLSWYINTQSGCWLSNETLRDSIIDVELNYNLIFIEKNRKTEFKKNPVVPLAEL